jgi:uncharacterized membrane protein
MSNVTQDNSDPSPAGPRAAREAIPGTSAPPAASTNPSQTATPGPRRSTRPEHTEAKPAGSELQPVLKAKERESRAVPSKPFTEHLHENVAGMLSYLFGWISGLVFLLVDCRPFVRYHAAQSVVVFATLNVLFLVLGGFFFASFVPSMGTPLLVLRRIVELVWIFAAVVLMLKAYSGERFRVGYAAKYADRAAQAKE